MHTLIPKDGAPPPSSLPPGAYWDCELGRYVEPSEPEWSWEVFDWLNDGPIEPAPRDTLKAR